MTKEAHKTALAIQMNQDPEFREAFFELADAMRKSDMERRGVVEVPVEPDYSYVELAHDRILAGDEVRPEVRDWLSHHDCATIFGEVLRAYREEQ